MASGCYIGQRRLRETSEQWEAMGTCLQIGMVIVGGLQTSDSLWEEAGGARPQGWEGEKDGTSLLHWKSAQPCWWGICEVRVDQRCWRNSNTNHPSHRSILKGEKAAGSTMGPNMCFHLWTWIHFLFMHKYLWNTYYVPGTMNVVVNKMVPSPWRSHYVMGWGGRL